MNENPLLSSKKNTSEICKDFDTNISTGLSSHSVHHRRSIYGFNELTLPPSESFFSKLKEQFSDILVIILLLAAIISFITNLIEEGKSEEQEIPPWVEPLVIFLILIVNAGIGIYQDFNAENALKALKKLNTSEASVLRDSIWQVVPSRDLVPGDIIKISTGNKIPADLRILKIDSLIFQVNQAILTGESKPVSKIKDEIGENSELSVFEMKNMLFSGTLVVQGNALAVVVAIGDSTQIGIIEKEVVIASEDKEENTPLRQKLNEFGDKLAKGIGILCLLIWLLNFINFFDSNGNWIDGALHYFKISVSLAVAAIPEGLPAVITTCLALGTRRMAIRNAIVRNLTSVETLGCTNVICTDKTGTLTTNEICVHRFCYFSQEESQKFSINDYEVEGTDYSFDGKIRSFSKDLPLKSDENLKLFCSCLTICNDSHLIYREDKREKLGVVGLPLEGALRVLVEKIGRNMVKSKNSYSQVGELELYTRVFKKGYSDFKTLAFTSERKMMSVLCKEGELEFDSSNILFTKGAPEILLSHSKWILDKENNQVPLDMEKKEAISQKIQEYSKLGLRCLGVGYKNMGKMKKNEEVEENGDLEVDLSFLGLVGMEDPPRPEVKESIQICKNAGIQIIVINNKSFDSIFYDRWPLEI